MELLQRKMGNFYRDVLCSAPAVSHARATKVMPSFDEKFARYKRGLINFYTTQWSHFFIELEWLANSGILWSWFIFPSSVLVGQKEARMGRAGCFHYWEVEVERELVYGNEAYIKMKTLVCQKIVENFNFDRSRTFVLLFRLPTLFSCHSWLALESYHTQHIKATRHLLLVRYRTDLNTPLGS